MVGSETVELVPSAMAAGGRALARQPSGRVVFVEGALPGERVRARLVAEKRDFAEAVTVEVLAPSPARVAPPCPALAEGCGGCTWQHVDAVHQVELKAAVVVDALRRTGGLANPPTPLPWPLSGPALRTSARLVVGTDGRAGHRQRATGGDRPGAGPVPTGSCLAAHPLLEDLIVHGRYPGADEVVLRVSAATGERLVLVRPASAAAAAVMPPGTKVAGAGEGRAPWLHEEVAGARLRVTAGSFFQPGPVAAEALVGAVDEAIGDSLGDSLGDGLGGATGDRTGPAGGGPGEGPGDPGSGSGGHLLDAYAGVGLFGAVLGARHGARVTAVERSPSAAADARANLAGIDAHVLEIEVGRWRPRGAPVDVVVADPARSGLGRPGTTALARSAAPRLVLVSCDPASLARDSALLAQFGFSLSALWLVDAFPHTFHVETVARFDR